jgi:hypothetical protein
MSADLAAVAPRLGQLVRLLASDRDGEVLSAGRTLKGIGADFHTLADLIERPSPAALELTASRPESAGPADAAWLHRPLEPFEREREGLHSSDDELAWGANRAPVGMARRARSENAGQPAEASMTPEQTAIRARFQVEFDDGARCAFLLKFPGERESGGYPRGFHRWSPDRRNAWLAGFNRGFHDRLRRSSERVR